jgi:hypothetical protein
VTVFKARTTPYRLVKDTLLHTITRYLLVDPATDCDVGAVTKDGDLWRASYRSADGLRGKVPSRLIGGLDWAALDVWANRTI